MLCFPNCKINLGLYITNRRADGYHDLETVFYPVMLQDVLELVPAATNSTHISGLSVAGDQQDNLVWKALQLMQAKFPEQVTPVAIYLRKAIPMGAGLGGGSADGAFMLRLLNDHFKLGATTETLAAMALQLGSDCPFFVYNTPQFAAGRGEQMSQTPIDLSAYSIQLICPQVHVSTREAFGLIRPQAAAFNLRNLAALPVQQWKDNISNDFEAPVFAAHPALASIKDQLYAQGAVYASMSGSGSALYGIFPKDKKATITSTVAFRSYYL